MNCYFFQQRTIFCTTDNPGLNDGGLGQQAVRSMLDEARQLASQLANPSDRSRLNGLCSDIERLANQLAGKIISRVTKLVQNSALDLENRGLGNSPEANAIRQQLRNKLHELSDFMKRVLTDKVVEDFVDINT